METVQVETVQVETAQVETKTIETEQVPLTVPDTQQVVVPHKKVKLKAFAIDFLKNGVATTLEISTAYIAAGHSDKDVKKVQASLAVTFCNMLKDPNSVLARPGRGMFGLADV